MFPSDEFPRVSQYLAGLPDGLASHPAARVSSELVWPVRDLLASSDIPLPEPLAGVVEGRFREEWTPEVWAGALLLAARDRVFESDEAWFAWTEDANEGLAYRPLGRMVLRNTSPREHVTRMTQRWALFHQGTVLGVGDVEREDGREWVPFVLTYPPRLYDRLLIDRGSHAFLRQLQLSRARNPAVEVVKHADEEAWFRLSWDVPTRESQGRRRRG